MDTVGILIPLEWQLSSTKTREHPKLKFFASLLWSVGSLGFRISTNIVGLFLKKKKRLYVNYTWYLLLAVPLFSTTFDNLSIAKYIPLQAGSESHSDINVVPWIKY